jgi:hypothetical protein
MRRRLQSIVLSTFALPIAVLSVARAQTPAPAVPAPAPEQPGAGAPARGRQGRGAETPPPTLDVGAIDRALGEPGQMLGEVYEISFLRSDLSVTVGDIRIKAGFGLGGWAAFKLAPAGNQAVVHGDLVLAEAEVNPVISALQQHDFDMITLHDRLLNASPRVMSVRFWAQGSPGSLAASLKDILGKTTTPPASRMAPEASADGLPADKIQEAVGLKGTVAGGVLSLSQPRPETIQMMGVTVPPSMGMATAMTFQSAGGDKVAATGEFVMVADEVNRVARTLRQHDIEITALHNQTMHGSPELYGMRFWAVGDPAKIGAGLKAALGQLKK